MRAWNEIDTGAARERVFRSDDGKTRGRAVAAAVLAASAALWIVGRTERERPVVTAAAGRIGALEAAVAARPADGERTRALAQEYLDAHLPGLALALVQAAPSAVHDDLRLRHLYARALIDEGRNGEALHAEQQVLGACEPLADGRAADHGCDPVLLVSAIRRANILRELVSLGVEDALAHPEAARVAYQNATREATVALE